MAKAPREPHQNVYRSRKQIVIDNLLGGIAWGLGSIIGATIVVSLIGFLLSQVETVPFIGKIVQNVVQEIDTFQEK